ncbi:MAG TPA: protein translocase subunit SecF [Propionibacteriaceae bacterium]|nr:protein translocase subunit SecF [Propionibacteriaceae bacterium]
MSRFSELGHRLYTGDVSYDFIARRRRWYLISAVMMAISLAALLGFRLTWGIEFSGGADFRANTQVTSSSVPQMRTALEGSGVPGLEEAAVTTINNNQIRVQTRPLNAVTEVPKVRGAIANEVGVKSEAVAYNLIGASWGSQITNRALLALAVFLVLVALVIWIYFRNGTMSAAALVALGHDLLLTIGIYALVGFTVTPATLIGVLTILGYSLYDTVVVFDKVRENVRDLKSSTVRTYSEAANLALNQVLVRSINTTIIGVLPVAALLFAGAVILGEGPLKDLALALFVGMIAGAYSSIFIAVPMLAQLKERDPELRKHASRVASRRAKEASRGRSTQAGQTGTGGSHALVTSGQGTTDPGVPEPTNEELAVTGSASGPTRPATGATRITLEPTTAPPTVASKPLTEGGAKRPQPQHLPRSQRRK